MNVGDLYTLRCGHVGRVIWTDNDGDTMAVRDGYHPSCPVCYKNRRTRNVYLIPQKS